MDHINLGNTWLGNAKHIFFLLQYFLQLSKIEWSGRKRHILIACAIASLSFLEPAFKMGFCAGNTAKNLKLGPLRIISALGYKER